ncbi:uncharacterized protein LOC116158836 isoform X1 [Photinus pyralis]|nr:uncharacterized protein LOC116158836 isoform X1 [Photinus pyralis]
MWKKLYFFLYLVIMAQDSNSSLLSFQRNEREETKNCPVPDKSSLKISSSLLGKLMLLSALMCLIILGIIKGILGLCCCAPVGMWSLGALIDLPRPIDSYQEGELAHIPVVYDQTGWPVHPETGQRTVRALPKKTEFFLNTVFFLAYPLAVLVSICSACCFKESAEHESGCYKCVNTVVFNTCVPSASGKESGDVLPIYSDDDASQEIKDTHYVVNQMRYSQQSLINKSSWYS